MMNNVRGDNYNPPGGFEDHPKPAAEQLAGILNTLITKLTEINADITRQLLKGETVSSRSLKTKFEQLPKTLTSAIHIDEIAKKTCTKNDLINLQEAVDKDLDTLKDTLQSIPGRQLASAQDENPRASKQSKTDDNEDFWLTAFANASASQGFSITNAVFAVIDAPFAIGRLLKPKSRRDMAGWGKVATLTGGALTLAATPFLGVTRALYNWGIPTAVVSIPTVVAYAREILGRPNIPILTMPPKQLLEQLQVELDRCIIGQPYAKEVVLGVVVKSLAEGHDPTRPRGVLFFAGPTGVGKTKVAKTVARVLCGSEQACFELKGGEYQDAHSKANIQGAAHGYHDSDKGGNLPNHLQKHPYSVVLLDEFEKAHEDIRKLFLAPFDDGSFQDRFGNEIDCKNVIFIMTSNLGADSLLEQNSRNLPIETIQEEVIQDMQIAGFAPEFIGRITDVVPFFPFTKDEMEPLVKLCLKELGTRPPFTDIEVTCKKQVIDYLIRKGINQKRGARGLKVEIEKIATLVSRDKVNGKIGKNDVVELYIDEQDKINYKKINP